MKKKGNHSFKFSDLFETRKKKKKSQDMPVPLDKSSHTSDSLPFTIVNIRIEKALKCQHHSEQFKKAAFMLLLMANTSLRYSDAIRVVHEVIRKEKLKFKAQKNKLNVETEFNKRVIKAYDILYKDKRLKGFIFTNTRGGLISNQYLNKVAKYLFCDLVSKGYHVSSHSMRKTYSDRFLDCCGNKFEGVYMLQKNLGHKNVETTFRYVNSKTLRPKSASMKRLRELKK